MEPAPAIEPGTGTAWVLARLTRPYHPVRATAALLGLPQRGAAQLVGSTLATSEEAEDLLAAMPKILRSMAIAVTDRPERCHGELRGPVLWSETMSVRSTSVGDPGLFVCATTTKAYDTSENRILKAALAAIASAGHAATHGFDQRGNDTLRRARHNEHQARHLLEHRALSAVPIVQITGRAIRRTAAGSRRTTYRPAISMLARSQEPMSAHQIQEVAAPATIADHDLFAAALAAVDALGDPPALLNDAGGLAAGPIRYAHLEGVTIGGATIADATEIAAALERAASGSART